jgi:thiol peroxidase
MKAVKKGRKVAKKVAKKVAREATQLKKKVSKGKDKLQSKLEKEMMKMQKGIAEKGTMIKKLKGELVEKEKAINKNRKSLLEKAKGSLVEWKGKAEAEAKKLVATKDSLIERLEKELADKENIIRQSEKTLKEAMGMAGKEVSAIREKTNQTLSEWRGKAETEYKKLREELENKSQTLSAKVKELEEYRNAMESKLVALQVKAKEKLGKVITQEKERTGLVTFKGNPMTLVGEEVKVGDRAPNFQVVDNAMQPVTLDSFKGKVKIISCVPSLDTPVCDMETRRFNEEAGKLPDKFAVLTVSMDLPFAQKRWCAAAGVEKVKTFSDYQNRSFGCAYGVLIKELKLLARTVFIVDEQDVVRYVEIVPEIAKEPDYDRVLNAAKAVV